MTCAACLREVAAACRRGASKPRFWLGPLLISWRALQFTSGLLVAWIFFQLLGHWLGNLPDDFHAGTLWENITGNQQ